MRHVFTMFAGGEGLATRDQRAESSNAAHGVVEEAAYLERRARGWLHRLLPWKLPPKPRLGDMRFALPFDDEGLDVLGLCRDTAVFDERDMAVGASRRVAGEVVCLEPRAAGDEIVLRDFWLPAPPVFRLVEMLDFGVLPPAGSPVAVCCAMAPLVVARPSPCATAELVAELGPRAAATALRHTGHRSDEEGHRLELREGDAVEVIGVVHEPAASRHRFGDPRRRTCYREAPRTIDWILGDTPGDRLVVRKA